MKIFKENGNVRLQLMDIQKGIMLFDFTIEAETYPELKEHIIEHLSTFDTPKQSQREFGICELCRKNVGFLMATRIRKDLTKMLCEGCESLIDKKKANKMYEDDI